MLARAVLTTVALAVRTVPVAGAALAAMSRVVGETAAATLAVLVAAEAGEAMAETAVLAETAATAVLAATAETAVTARAGSTTRKRCRQRWRKPGSTPTSRT